MEKSIDFTLSQSQSQSSSQNLVLVKSSLSIKRRLKITAREENLLAIHRRILLHLKNEKPLTKFELRKLLAILKRTECASPRDKKTAQSAYDILVKCISSQKSKKDYNPGQYSSNSTSHSSATTTSNDSDYTEQLPNYKSENPFQAENTSKHTFTEHVSMMQVEILPNQLYGNHKAVSSDIFTSQTQDDEMAFVKDKTSFSDSEKNDSIEVENDTVNIQNYKVNIENDRVVREPFSVPSLLEEGDNSVRSQRPNVIQLRIQDVQFDSDTVSIPIELLTGLNFESGEDSQGAASKYPVNPPKKISHNTILSFNNTEYKDTDFTERNDSIVENNNTTSNRISSLGLQFDPINENQPQNPFRLTHPDFPSSSSNTNKIESVSSPNRFLCASSTLGQKDDENIYCSSTSKSRTALPTISSYLSNVATPLSINKTNIINTDLLKWGEASPNIKGTLFKSDGNNIEKSSNASKKPNNNKTDPENKNSDAPSLDHIHSKPTNHTMELDKSWLGEQEDLQMTDAERTYLEMAALGTESETNDFIFDWNKTSTVMNQNEADKAEEGSFVFNLENNYSSEIIEATPLDNLGKKSFQNKIKSVPFRKPDEQTSIKKVRAMSQTQDNIIDETPCSLDDTPVTETSQSVIPRIETPIWKMRNAFDPSKKWPNSIGFQEISQSYEKKFPNTMLKPSKINILRNIRGNKNTEPAQSRRLANISAKDESSKNKIDQPINFGMTDRSFLDQFVNNSPIKTPTNPRSNGLQKMTQNYERKFPKTMVKPNKNSKNQIGPPITFGMTDRPFLKQFVNNSPIETPTNQRSNGFQEMSQSCKRKFSKTVVKPCKFSGNMKVIEPTQSQCITNISAEDNYPENKIDQPINFGMTDRSFSRQFINSSPVKTPTKIGPPNPKGSISVPNQEISQSENFVFIDGTIAKNSDEMDNFHVEPEEEQQEEEETFEEKTRKLKEKILQKRNKYRHTWNNKPVTEKVSLKYVRKFGLNIYENPASSLLNINYNMSVNNFNFPRLTMKEIDEKLQRSSEKANLLDEALTKMINSQISASAEENYLLKMTRNAVVNSDSNLSDEEEQKKKKRMFKEMQNTADGGDRKTHGTHGRLKINSLKKFHWHKKTK